MSIALPQRIYFDESGYTGNQLLRSDQSFFCYASVATDDAEAEEVVTMLRTKYRVQSVELKGANLVSSKRGQKLVWELLEHFEGRILVTIADKHFALACKIFEYVFEPCIAAQSEIFYRIGFHRFIANLLHFSFRLQGAGADELFVEFQYIMRNFRKGAELSSLFSKALQTSDSDSLQKIVEFARANVGTISEELDSIKNMSVGKWSLDLTTSSAWSLLCEWGKKYSSITAICDDSKPLAEQPETFLAMVGNRAQQFTTISGKPTPFTFNLSEPPIMRGSTVTPGIQIADVLAAATVFVATSTDKATASKWQPLLPDIQSVLSDSTEIDVRNPRCILSSMLLHELHHRAMSGKCLHYQMGQFIQTAAVQAAAVARAEAGRARR